MKGIKQMPMGSPLKRLIFITGTDTGVGKTVVTAGLLAVFQKKGYKTLVIKPFQTGSFYRQGNLISPDVEFYKETGLPEEPQAVLNPVSLEPPAAPWVASILSKRPINLTKVYKTIEEILPNYDLVILEGAGGLCVPIQKEFMMADFAKELGCPVLIVARSNLGTINHTLLTVSYAKLMGLPLLGVVVNSQKPGNDDVENLNPWVIKELSGIPMLGVMPYSSFIDVDSGKAGDLVEKIEENINFDELEEAIFGKSGGLG